MVTTASPKDFYSDPQIRHLTQVLEDIHRGALLIPRFQRPLVWSPEMRIALLDSILEGIPIGTIMTWRTELEDVAVQKRLGPFALPEPHDGERQYLLDGEQRLSTLYFALYSPEPAAPEARRGDEDLDAFQYYFDLATHSFAIRAELDDVTPYHLPLTDLLQGAKLTRFQRQLARIATEEELEALIEMSDWVADAFRQYKLPVVTIKANELELVTRTFQRVNSQHVAMNEVHMVNALSYSEEFDLLERIQTIKQEQLAAVGWEGIAEQIFLQVCKVALNLRAYEEDADAVSEQFKAHPESLAEAARDIIDAAQFFRNDCGIGHPELVPYTAQIILVTTAMRLTKELREPGTKARARLSNWLWLTTYLELFQLRMNEPWFLSLLGEAHALVNGIRFTPPRGRQVVRRRLERFDFRSARSRALALLLAQQGPLGPDGQRLEASDLLALHRVDALPQLVTASMAKPRWSNSPGARVLLPPGAIVDFRAVLKSTTPPPFLDQLLASHVISPEAHRAFVEGRYDAFVEIREEELNQLEEAKFQAVLARLYPST
jgi:hypothetical protein